MKDTRLGPRVKLYIGTVTLATLALLAVALLVFGVGWELRKLVISGVFALTLLVAGLFPVPMAPRLKVEVTTAVTFAAAMLLPVPLAMLVAGSGFAASARLLRRPWHVVVFNSAEASLRVGIGAFIFHALSFLQVMPGSTYAAYIIWGGIPVAITMYLLNTVVVGGVVAVELKQDFRHLWRQMGRQGWAPECALFSVGFLLAILLDYMWFTSLLLIPPAVIIYFAFKEKVQKEEMSRRLQNQMEELKQTQAKLIQSSRLASLGTLAAGIAHEVSNPVFVIEANTELLLSAEGGHLKTPESRRMAGVILSMCQRVTKIVTNLLSFSRDRSYWEVIELHRAMDESLELMERALHSADIAIQRRYQSGLPRIQGNISQVQQVIVNIVLNARDAMPQGGELTISTCLRDGEVCCSFRDTGAGIPPENLERIFEPFFTTKEVGRGTGLGLYISQRIMEEHGGTIQVASAPGEGTTITLGFPPAPAHLQPPRLATSGLVAVAYPSNSDD